MERCETLIAVLSISRCSLRNLIIFLWKGKSDSGFVDLAMEDAVWGLCPKGGQLTYRSVADFKVLSFIAMNRPPI